MSVGDTVWASSGSGNKQALVSSNLEEGGPGSFYDLVSAESAKEWCPSCADGAGCVVEAGQSECFVGESGLIREAPVVNPEVAAGGANTYTVIDDFIGTFIEKVACAADQPQFGGPAGAWNVYVRLIVNQGSGGGGPDAEVDPGATLLRTLRLVE